MLNTAVLLSALVALLSHAPVAGEEQSPRPEAARVAAWPLEIQEVAPGIHVVSRQKPPGFLSDANTVFIVNEDDVIVVDTNLTPASAEASIAALERITKKPVRVVINTHWHVDHVSGNQVYRRRYPGVEIVGHRRTRADLVDKGAQNRREMRQQAQQFVSMLQGLMAKGQNMAGQPLSVQERASYEADIRLTQELIEAIPGIEIVPPTLAVEDGLTLTRGSREVRVMRLGRSHTHGDLVVFLPKEGVVVTGDLVVGPTPLVGGDQSFVSDWVASLDRLLQLPARIYVPGHGPVLRDREYVIQLRAFLEAVEQQAIVAQERRQTLEQARESLALDRFKDGMAGQDPVLRTLFDAYGKNAALAATFRDGAKPVPTLPSIELPVALDRVLRDYERAWQARDAAGLAALFAEDGFVLSNGRPAVRGRDSIRQHYTGAGGPLALRALAYAADERTGYIIGAFAQEKGGPDIGKFVLAVSRGPDGRWMIAADIDNSLRN